MPRMSALKLVLWGFLAVLGSVALAFVVGLVNPQEKVNGLWLVAAAACIYVLAFRFYGRWSGIGRGDYGLTWVTSPFGAVVRI
jgi:carbon starvation protein